MADGFILALTGGIGGAKLCLGLQRMLPPGSLRIAVNTGDDFEHLGLHICPDIDTTIYTLSGIANPELGWGRRDETWTFMRTLATLGGETWFQLGDGDLALHVERTRRLAGDDTDEYVAILKRIWTEQGPIDHHGRYYQFEGASTAVRCVQSPHIPIYFGGASDAAIEVAGRHADVYALWGETQAQVREIVARVRAAAARHGRTVRFSLSLRPVLAATEDEAWARAERIKARIVELRGEAALKVTDHAPANEGSRRLLAAAAAGDRLDQRLWTGAAAVTGARGNTTGLVGTPHQVAEAMADYYDLGVTTFLIRGFDPLDDAIEYGRDLLPLTRQLIAARRAASTQAPAQAAE